jgi:hypothetical protein
MDKKKILNDVLESAFYTGIATADPTPENLTRAANSVEGLKRQCNCWIKDEAKWKKEMPMHYAMSSVIPSKADAEIIRGALREVARCCLKM